MLDLLTNALSGGATGIIGSLSAGFFSAWKARQNHKHEIELRKLDLQEMEREAANAEKQMAHETRLAEQEGKTKGMLASYAEAGSAYYGGDSTLLRVADFVRKMVRPVVLVTLSGFVMAIYFTTDQLCIREQITAMTVYLFSTAVIWYFGGRHMEKAERNHLK